MRKGNRAISIGVSALIVIAIIIIAGFGVFIATSLNASESTTTLGSSITSGTSSYSTTATTSISVEGSSSASSVNAETSNSTLGLELLLSANSTVVPSQDAISMTATIFNTLPTPNNLTAANDWAIQGLSSGPCDLGNGTNKLFSPVGFAVYSGSYGLNNISSAGRPLPVWAAISCPVDMAFNGTKIIGDLANITSYSFFPQGANNPGNDSGSYAGYYVVSSPSPPPCNSTVCTYYQTPETLAKGVFPTSFDSQATIYAANGTGFYNSLGSSLPSNYTLVVGDEWGQIVLLQFEVTSSSNLPTVGNFLAFGGCFENEYPVPCTVTDFSDAMIFNCASAAATSSGCTLQGNIGPNHPSNMLSNYTITVWYPDVNQTNEPAHDNCMFSVKGDTTTPFGYCFMVNSTAFVISL